MLERKGCVQFNLRDASFVSGDTLGSPKIHRERSSVWTGHQKWAGFININVEPRNWMRSERGELRNWWTAPSQGQVEGEKLRQSLRRSVERK